MGSKYCRASSLLTQTLSNVSPQPLPSSNAIRINQRGRTWKPVTLLLNNLLWFPTLASKPKTEFLSELVCTAFTRMHSELTSGESAWPPFTQRAWLEHGGERSTGPEATRAKWEENRCRGHTAPAVRPTGWQRPFCGWRNIWLTALTLEDLLSGLRKRAEKAARSKKMCSQVALL